MNDKTLKKNQSSINRPKPSDPEYMGGPEMRIWLRELGLPSGNTWLHAAIREGILPKPIKIGNRNYWSRDMREQFRANLNKSTAA